MTERFDGYWQEGLPYLDAVEVKVITDDTTRMAALRSGDVHLMQGFPANLLETIANDNYGFEPILDPSTWTLLFNFNALPSPIDDIRVRQAIGFAMNKDELMRSRIGDAPVGEVSKMPSSSGEFWYLPEFEDAFPAQDLDRTAALLSEAGYGEGLPELSFPATIEVQKHAEVLAGQLAAAGIPTNLEIIDRTAYRERYERFDWHIILNVTGPRTDPSAKYSSYYSGAAAEGLANPNLPEVDELYLEAIRITDPEARREVWGRLWTVMQTQEVAAISAWHDSNVYAFDARVQAFRPGRTFYLHSVDGGLARSWMAE
jgi:ABC-type transport system substrate-binding protein